MAEPPGEWDLEVARLEAELSVTGGLELGRQYAAAPITDAILQLMVEPRSDLELADLETFDFDGFTGPSPMFHFSGQVNLAPGEAEVTETNRRKVGFVFTSDNERAQIHCAPDRFAFYSKRSPYSGWNEFVGHAESAWLSYKHVARPADLNAVSTRFVNRIPLPARAVEIRDYLRMSVDVPGYLPQAVRSLFMQVEIPVDRLDVTALVTSETVDPTDAYPGGALVLDIDVVTPVNVTVASAGFQAQLGSALRRLHLAKNYVFEACITDATRKLIG